MGKIWMTSDLHLFHNREFLYGPRGFSNVEDMVKAIVQNWQTVVSDDDDVYVLGDLMLNDDARGMEVLRKLKGRIHIVLGNHDTDTRLENYKKCPNVVEIANAIRMNYNGYHFFLCHYPTVTANFGDNHKTMKQVLINLHGHTHQQVNYLMPDNPYVYHVGLDSHNNRLVLLDNIIDEIREKIQ